MAINNFCLVPAVLLFILLLFSIILPPHHASVHRLSQIEGIKKLRAKSSKDMLAASPDYGNEKGIDKPKTVQIVCGDGWLNFRNQLCFLGIHEPQLPFAYGNQQCGKFGANYTSVHSMAEFQFIVENFDLRKFWIGVMYGADNYEDGTVVEQDVLHQFAPFVPWTDPNTPKGFVCRAFPINANRMNGFINEQSVAGGL